MDLDAVFFDLYGTLLIYGDMEAAWSAWLEALHDRLCDLGVTVEPERLQRQCDGFFGRPEPELDGAPLTVYERRLAGLCQDFGLPARPDHLRMLADETAAAWQRHVAVDPDAAPVLGRLKQSLPLALVSNFDHPPHVRSVLGEAGLLDLFDAVVVSADVGIKKPDPGIFSPPLETLGVDPARVAFVGDAPEDMAAAEAAGLVSILLRRRSGATWVAAADYRSEPATDAAGGPAAGSVTIAGLRELLPLILQSTA